MNNGSVNYAGTTFTLGQPTVPNAITNGAVYTLPSPGNYSNVYLIGAATTTGQTKQPFILTYSTGAQYPDPQHELMGSKSAGYAGETSSLPQTYANTQSRRRASRRNL